MVGIAPGYRDGMKLESWNQKKEEKHQHQYQYQYTILLKNENLNLNKIMIKWFN